MHLPKPFAPLLYAMESRSFPAHILEPVWKAGNFNHYWGINTPPDKIIGTATSANPLRPEPIRELPAQRSLLDEGRAWRAVAAPAWRRGTDNPGRQRHLSALSLRTNRHLSAAGRRGTGSQAENQGRPAPRNAERNRHRHRRAVFLLQPQPAPLRKHGVTDPKLPLVHRHPYFLRAMAHAGRQAGNYQPLSLHGLAVPAVSEVPRPRTRLSTIPTSPTTTTVPRPRRASLSKAGGLSQEWRPALPTRKAIRWSSTSRPTPDLTEARPNLRHPSSTGPLAHLGIKVNYQPAGVHHAGRQARRHL